MVEGCLAQERAASRELRDSLEGERRLGRETLERLARERREREELEQRLEERAREVREIRWESWTETPDLMVDNWYMRPHRHMQELECIRRGVGLGDCGVPGHDRGTETADSQSGGELGAGGGRGGRGT